MPNKASVFTYDGVNGVGSFACPAACRAVVNTQSGQGWNPVTLFGKGDGQRAFASGENPC